MAPRDAPGPGTNVKGGPPHHGEAKGDPPERTMGSVPAPAADSPLKGHSGVRAGLYLRVSTEDQAREGYSLADQERRGREVAHQEGWEPVIYREPGRSGADRDRPELARLLRDVEASALGVVWFDTQSRLARDVGHTADLVAAFVAADVSVWEGWHPIDLSDDGDGQAQVDLKALFDAWERRKIRARTRKGIAERAREGKPWGPPRYGYRRREDGHWEPDPAEEPVVRRIFTALLPERTSYNGVAAALEAEGVPPRHGTMWRPGMVGKLVKSRHVLGEYWFAGEWHRGEHRAIVSEAEWQAAQCIAEQSAKWTPKGGGRLPARHILIRGKLKCGLCGEAMLPRTDSRRKSRRETYECARHLQDAGTCPMPALPREAVEGPLLAMFERHALDVAATRDHVAAQLGASVAEARAQAARAGRDAGQKRAALARFDRDYEAGELSAANYERQVARVTEELEAAEAEQARLTAHAEGAEGALAGLDAEGETLRRLAALREEVAGRVSGAGGDVGALRAAVAQVFDAVWVLLEASLEDPELTLHRPLRDGSSVAPWGGLCVAPCVRREMFEPDAAGYQVLQRVGLPLGADNQHGTLVS